jgi:hypothetical protein
MSIIIYNTTVKVFLRIFALIIVACGSVVISIPGNAQPSNLQRTPPKSNVCTTSVNSTMTVITQALDGEGKIVCNNGSTSSASIRFSLTAKLPGTESLAGFECSIDNQTFTRCASPANFFGLTPDYSTIYPKLVPNTHSFKVRAVLQSGTLDPNPPTFNWTVVASPVRQTLPQTARCTGALPCGLWDFNANGLAGVLLIDAVNRLGIVNGSLNSYPINGSWDEVSKRITFTELLHDNRSMNYSGFLNNLCGHYQIIAVNKYNNNTLSQPCFVVAGSYTFPAIVEKDMELSKNVTSVDNTNTGSIQHAGWIGFYLGK